ncbi:hypothetical protein [Aliamphritea hakodatensis]|uniref:hypothetical protein n=1 Tax=Aliamphritea hakodatensis TaxID=2895352 RepID=UPI0022FD63F5|nr:hypothetical protein [Aliamphritea hakodatensis]
MSFFKSALTLTKNALNTAEAKYIEKSIVDTQKKIDKFKSLKDYIENFEQYPVFETVTIDNLKSTKSKLKEIDLSYILIIAKTAKEKKENIINKISNLNTENIPEVIQHLIPIPSDINIDNLSDAEGAVKSIQTIINAETLFQDESIEFNSYKFYKRHDIDAFKATKSYMESPNLVANLGLSNMFGGAVGAAYAAQSIVGTAITAGNRSVIMATVEGVDFYRNIQDLNDSEKFILATAFCLKEEGLFSNKDYQDAYHGFIWNDAQCSYKGIGKKTNGAFSDIELNEKSRFGLAIAVKLISSCILDRGKINTVIYKKGQELNPAILEYLINKYPSQESSEN